MRSLEEIGFYTLSDSRARNVSIDTPLWRCELILTDKCNFNCSYCQGISEKYSKQMSIEEAKKIIDLWAEGNLKNIRFSGGEPTIWKPLPELVAYSKENEIDRIAISTNGSASLDYYYELIKLGVNDFSISLDACCASTGDKMSGVKGSYQKIIDNIKELSKIVYVTVGIVLTKENMNELSKTIELASDELSVSDIRIITAAQWNAKFKNLNVRTDILSKHPILKYRVTNFKNGKHIRGIKESDNNRCPLVLDDMAIAGEYHFPCIIYLRRHGSPIGKITNLKQIRKERFKWFKNHNTFKDPICNYTCLDVCVDYNNKVRELKLQERKDMNVLQANELSNLLRTG